MAETPFLPAAGEDPALRRLPKQQRSRDRVERILEVASALIGEVGSDAMKMSAVAQRAEISIGSLYQYFPDKTAIVHTLAGRYYAESRRCIEEGLAQVEDPGELGTAFSGLIDIYYGVFLREPAMRDIWSATQADKGLAASELEASRANGALLADTVLRLAPKASRRMVEPACFLLIHLGEATMRLAIAVGRTEGDVLVEAFKAMARADLQRLLEG